MNYPVVDVAESVTGVRYEIRSAFHIVDGLLGIVKSSYFGICKVGCVDIVVRR